MGLNAVVAVTDGHAFAGAWLIDEKLPILTNDDPQDVRKRVDNRDLILFETTLVTNDSPVTFEQARERARELISEDKASEFVMVIDVAQARAQSIKPLSTVEEAKDPDKCNVFALYKCFSTETDQKELASRYRAGGMGYGEAKQLCFEALNAELSGPRENYQNIRKVRYTCNYKGRFNRSMG